MTVNKRLFSLILVVACMGNYHLKSQDFGLEYYTEWQTNFKSDYNWANLLKLTASVPVSSHLTLEGSTISVARVCAEPLADDMQGYSNIDAESMELAFATLGAGVTISNSTIFLGIRNVNEDYFTSPVTSFFTNSSCGIFPTLAANYDIANYPLSSWCAHYRYASERFAVQTSLYEGRGHSRILGHDNVFTFSPADNGLFSITSADYYNNGSNYSLGCAVYYGVCCGDDVAVEKSASSPKKTLSCAPWINVEQRLTDRWMLMAQFSIATPHTLCRTYCGLGTTVAVGRVELGAFCNFAGYSDMNEIATELTCRVPLTGRIYVQPAFDIILTGKRLHTIGLLRMVVEI